MRNIVLAAAAIFASLSFMAAAWADPPPNAPRPPVTLRFTVVTGNDDLRGGGDNVRVHVRLHGQTFTRVLNQRGMRWADGTTNVVSLTLPSATLISDIESIEFETTSRGGVGGDNWNMNSAMVEWLVPPNGALVIARHGFKRFTGSDYTISMPIRPEFQRNTTGVIEK